MVKKIKPIRNMEDINRLRNRLSSNPRDLMIFDLITSAGLKLDDVLNLKVKDLDGLIEGDFIPVADPYADKAGKPVMTKRIKETYSLMLSKQNPLQDDYLVKSKKSNAALEPPSVSRLIAQWFRKEKLEGLAGVKSLRKTWELHFNKHNPLQSAMAPSGGGSRYGGPLTHKMSDQIHSMLLDLILTGKLTPGERLITRHIAEEMNVSPMPVRDALNRLAANGVVNLEANRSYYVNALSKTDLIEITDMRLILEPIAARQALEKIGPRRMTAITKIADRFHQAVEHEARSTLVQSNREFHFKIYGCTQNRKMISFIDQLWNMLSPYLYLLSEKSRFYNFRKGGYKNHQEIVSALGRRDHKSLKYWIKKDIEFAFEGIMAEFFK